MTRPSAALGGLADDDDDVAHSVDDAAGDGDVHPRPVAVHHPHVDLGAAGRGVLVGQLVGLGHHGEGHRCDHLEVIGMDDAEHRGAHELLEAIAHHLGDARAGPRHVQIRTQRDQGVGKLGGEGVVDLERRQRYVGYLRFCAHPVGVVSSAGGLELSSGVDLRRSWDRRLRRAVR